MSFARTVLFSGLMLSAVSCRSASAADAGRDAGPPGPHAELAWRLRCDASGGACTYPDRAIAGFDREGDVRVSCSVMETATTRTLMFEVLENNNGLFLMGAELPRAGGIVPSGGCSAGVVEGGGIWGGACGPGPPSAREPCLVNVVFSRDADGSLIAGEIFCDGATPLFSSAPLYEITGPGGDPTAPATFMLRNCPGYVPD